MRYAALLTVCLAIAACAARTLRCEGALQPINLPATTGETRARSDGVAGLAQADPETGSHARDETDRRGTGP
jgi:hypothetical protein